MDAVFVEKSSEVIDKTIKQLDEYFKGERQHFDIALLMVGTVFQKSVWNAANAISILIPYMPAG